MTSALEALRTISKSPIGTLKNHPNNARTHSKQQIRLIARSIEAFGFLNPVLIDSTNMIIAGHGRVAAAKLLGITTVPTILLENLTKDQIRAYVIADNKIAEKAGWDRGILAIELQHLLVDSDLDITITGFEVAEIDLIFEEAARPQDPEDHFLAPSTGVAISALGDLWYLGKHRLLCGNALVASSFDQLMNDCRAAAIFVDPPYNVAIDGHATGNGSISHREFAMASGEMNEADFTAFLTTSLKLLAQHSLPESIHYICQDWRHVGELTAAGRHVYDTLLNICVWIKDNGGMGSFYRSQHELIFVYRNGKTAHRNNIQLGKFGRNRTNVWQYPGVGTVSKQGDEGNLLAFHPTVKPIAMVADAVLDCTARGEIVLDSFLGSGTTLLAAERVGRICYGMEIDPLYVDTAIRRWQRLTGDVAVHSGTGKTFAEHAALVEVAHV